MKRFNLLTLTGCALLLAPALALAEEASAKVSEFFTFSTPLSF